MSLGGAACDPTGREGLLLFNVLVGIAEFESDLTRLAAAKA